MTREFKRAIVVLVLLCAPGFPSVAQAESQDEQIRQLKETLEQLQKTINEQNKQMQQTIDEQNRKIQELEKAQAKAPPPPPPAMPEIAAAIAGATSPITERGTLKDEQQAAPRPDDLTLDPKYRGFTRIPNTKVLIKFNAKPRTDMTYDNQNAGDDNRFITAKIPVEGDPTQGGKPVFNINAKGSQLRIDVRAPEIAGAPRFYYENDFYGSGGGEFPYRLRHLYGQIYNVIVGQTFSTFEDPDVWPDTVDYEGPNSAIFARRPLLRYQYRLNDEWHLSGGVEQPEAEIDTTTEPNANGRNSMPDLGGNVRWERSETGHVQFASMFRDIGVRGSTLGNQDVFGWGLNLSGNLDTFGRDTMQGQLTYGDGMFRYCNDDFQNNDAAFDTQGHLEAIPYFGAMLGYTHQWNNSFRSTLSYGYVHLDNTSGQEGSAYHQTHYASLNVMWQLRERLSVGLEELYGYHDTKDGAHGDVFRTTLGLVYSIFP